jgi:hypothetical protein
MPAFAGILALSRSGGRDFHPHPPKIMKILLLLGGFLLSLSFRFLLGLSHDFSPVTG